MVLFCKLGAEFYDVNYNLWRLIKYHNKIFDCIMVVIFSNIFFSKSKKENGFWTFLKCPF